MISRRAFVSRALGGLATGAGWYTFGSVTFKIRDANAQAAPGKVLVMIFQRGGADGLYLACPYGDDDYYRLRPDVNVARPAAGNANSALPLSGSTTIGLNPNLEPMGEIFDAGNLGIIPACHLTGSGRSHFDNQEWIGQGVIRGANKTGWMAKVLQNNPERTVFSGLTAGNGNLTTELKGQEAYPAISRTSDYSLGGDDWETDEEGCNENRLLCYMNEAYTMTDQAGLAVSTLTKTRGLAAVESLQSFASLDNDYTPTAQGLNYSNSRIGRGLRLVAQLVKAGIPLECVSVDWTGGWDSHDRQRPRNTGIVNSESNLHRTQRDGATNLLCFHRDMQGLWNDVCVLIGSEFGRTSRQNGSFGTDHGYAACWWVMGGTSQGGRIHGEWPGLASDRLQNGRFLAASVDCRDVMGEAIVKHLGYSQNVLSTVFPGHSYSDNAIFA